MRHLRSLIAVVFVALGALAACSGGADSTSADCESACDKAAACAAIPQADVGSCKAACGSTLIAACTNQSAIDSCNSACLAKTDCGAYQTCVTACPACSK